VPERYLVLCGGDFALASAKNLWVFSAVSIQLNLMKSWRCSAKEDVAAAVDLIAIQMPSQDNHSIPPSPP
jgi:hypothetical protein